MVDHREGDPLFESVRRFRHGAAPDELFQRVRRIAFAVARLEFGLSPPDAEDIAQEMTLRAYRRSQSAEFNFSWVATGTRFLCIDHLRSRNAESAAISRYGDDIRARPTFLAAMTEADIAAAMAGIPEHCRALLEQHFWKGMTWAEMDDVIDCGRRCSQYATQKCLRALMERLETMRVMNGRR
jgi:DNA-directed RNA polymerase specialized sigma24 family protein